MDRNASGPTTGNEISVSRVESARERDLDHLLMEEIYSNEDFRSWLTAHAKDFQPDEPNAIAAYRASRRQFDMRETDLRFDYLDSEDRCRACLLIENKVSADFQRGQAESYGQEISAMKTELGDRNATAILVAPARYHARREVAYFDAFVSIEDIESQLSNPRDVPTPSEIERRQQIKLGLLRQLLGRGSLGRTRPGSVRGDGWEPVVVSKKRIFSSRYSDLLEEHAPGFEVSQSSEGPNARTKIFYAFPGKNDGHLDIRLRHEFGRPELEPTKYVNLQVTGMAHRLRDLEARKNLFPEDGSIYLNVAGKSLSICIDTPSIQPDGERFDTESYKVVECIEALKKLVAWLAQNRAELERTLK